MSEPAIHLTNEARIARLEGDVRDLVVKIAVLSGVDGRNGRMADVAADQAQLAREFSEFRQAKVRTYVFLGSLIIAAVGAGFWAGVTATSLRASVDRVDRDLQKHLILTSEERKP